MDGGFPGGSLPSFPNFQKSLSVFLSVFFFLADNGLFGLCLFFRYSMTIVTMCSHVVFFTYFCTSLCFFLFLICFFPVSLHLSFYSHQLVSLCVRLAVGLSLHLSICVSICIWPSVSLSIFLYHKLHGVSCQNRCKKTMPFCF